MVLYVIFGGLALGALITQLLLNYFLFPRLLEKYSLEEFLVLYKDRSTFNYTHLISGRAVAKLYK